MKKHTFKVGDLLGVYRIIATPEERSPYFSAICTRCKTPRKLKLITLKKLQVGKNNPTCCKKCAQIGKPDQEAVAPDDAFTRLPLPAGFAPDPYQYPIRGQS